MVVSFSPQDFLLLHGLLFIKRSEIIKTNIRTLTDVYELYREEKEKKGIKDMYGYSGCSEFSYSTTNLFDIMVNYLVEHYSNKYQYVEFKTRQTLTKKLWNEYRKYAENYPKDIAYPIKIQEDYYNCYLDFIGVSNFKEFKLLAEKKGLVNVRQVENSIRFFKGYYCSDEPDQIKQLLLKVDFEGKKAYIFLPDYKSNSGDRYDGEFTCTSLSLAFELNSCEKEKAGRLYFITKIGFSPFEKLKMVDIFFGNYCSINSMGASSSGILGFEPIREPLDEENYNGWYEEVPLYFEYLLSQDDITFQRDYKQTRMVWNNVQTTSLRQFKSEKEEDLEVFEEAKDQLKKLRGIYECISLKSTGEFKTVSVSYFHIYGRNSVSVHILDSKYSRLIKYRGKIRINDSIYKFNLDRDGRKVEMLFEQYPFSYILYGVYVGRFHNSIAGGRILLRKIRFNEQNLDLTQEFKALKPKRIKLYSEEYHELIDTYPKFYQFFSGQNGDEYSDDINVVRFRNKSDYPLQLPKEASSTLSQYIGTYIIFFLEKDKKKAFIKACPINIDKNGDIEGKSLFSKEISDIFRGRAFVQCNKLYIHLYDSDWKFYYGNLIWQLPSEEDKRKNDKFVNQFVGSYNLGNKSNSITSGRLHVIQNSKHNTLQDIDVRHYPCYRNPYEKLRVDGSRIDLRKEFMGANYNYMKLSQAANGQLDVKKEIRKENYANVFFKSAIFSAQKGKSEQGKGKLDKSKDIIRYAQDLFLKALEHGWNEDELDEYDRIEFESHKDVLMKVWESFSEKYLS